MELEEIPNYKERVSFIEVDPKNIYPTTLPLTSKLYYNSSVLRKLSKRVKEHPAYFVSSYPTTVDAKLSVFTKIPILSGNLIELLKISCRSEIENVFKLPHLDSLVVAPRKYNIFALSNLIETFCQEIKRSNKFVVKINHQHQSTGIALLSYPFNSLPEMFSNTTLIVEGLVNIN